jgi:hypothetical protein
MVVPKVVKNGGSDSWRPTRRQLLGAAAVGTLGLLCDVDSGLAQARPPVASRPSPVQLPDVPWWLQRHGPRSRVVEVRSSRVLGGSVVDPITLGELLNQGMCGLTGAAGVSDAWRAVLGSAGRIVVKFNSVGASIINTNNAMAHTLVAQLAAAGYDPGRIALAEVPEFLAEELGTAQVGRGWGRAIEVGGRPEPLAQYLHDADAVINVPFLKTHQIAGMSGCLKNLSHALIRHPARYHANGCSPYVAQVVGSIEVSSRLKLNVVNAIRIVANRGPDAIEEDVVGYGGLLLGFDPVALDNVGLSILARERRRKGFEADLNVRYLASAAEMGLGRWRAADIERTVIDAGT